MYFRRKTSAGRAYLQIVESRRDGDQVRQQVIATLGRFDELQASGQLERLVRSGARFAAKAMVLSAASNDAAMEIAVRRIGPALVFERLWEETGCRAVIAELAGKRGHVKLDEFALHQDQRLLYQVAKPVVGGASAKTRPAVSATASKRTVSLALGSK